MRKKNVKIVSLLVTLLLTSTIFCSCKKTEEKAMEKVKLKWINGEGAQSAPSYLPANKFSPVLPGLAGSVP